MGDLLHRMAPMVIDRAEGDGYTVVTIPENVRQKLLGLKDLLGLPVRDLSEYIQQWNTSFQFTFVKPRDLKKSERRIFEKTNDILDILGGRQ